MLLRHHKLPGQKLFSHRHTIYLSVQGTLTDMEATAYRPARVKSHLYYGLAGGLITSVLALQLGYAVLISAADMGVLILSARPRKKKRNNPAPLEAYRAGRGKSSEPANQLHD